MKFDERTHTYTSKKGVILPSVTQVLPGPDEDAMLRPGFWEKTELGTRVHKACEIINKWGALKDKHYKELELQDIDIPYIDAWVNFLDDTGTEVVRAEMKVRSKKYDYAGTLDCLVRNHKGEVSILDLKTVTQLSPVTALQLAGYIIAYNEQYSQDVFRRQVVQLKPDATYKRVKYPVSRLAYDKSIFLAKLNSARWDMANLNKGGF